MRLTITAEPGLTAPVNNCGAVLANNCGAVLANNCGAGLANDHGAGLGNDGEITDSGTVSNTGKAGHAVVSGAMGGKMNMPAIGNSFSEDATRYLHQTENPP